ncbi:MAG: hypothetical protein KAI24_19270, partial [Planctomycetes bacterium]|nr:hypothetical protein [Planctomycetota bacterium]
MTPPPLTRSLTFAALAALGLPAQDWTDEQLVAEAKGFQSPSLVAQIEQVGRLVAAKDQAFVAVAARLHGDYREYRLKIDRLLDELCDPSWKVRENAERTLIEIGGRARTVIEKRRDDYEVLEQNIRCSRILAALVAKGTEQEDRERRLLQGLVRLASYFDADPRLLRSLRSALGHTDASIAGGAIRALGKHGGDDEARAVAPMVTFKSGLHRPIALSALARMKSDVALGYCRALLLGGDRTGPLEGVELDRTEMMKMVRALRARDDDGAAKLVADLRAHPDPVIAKGASVELPEVDAPVTVTLTLPDPTQVQGKLVTMNGDSFVVEDAFVGLPQAELSFNDCSTLDFPEHKVVKSERTMVFLNQGSRVAGEVLAVDPESVRIDSRLFGELTLRRSEIQGMSFDPKLDRL